jgi:hypothetical protein
MYISARPAVQIKPVIESRRALAVCSCAISVKTYLIHITILTLQMGIMHLSEVVHNIQTLHCPLGILGLHYKMQAERTKFYNLLAVVEHCPGSIDFLFPTFRCCILWRINFR